MDETEPSGIGLDEASETARSVLSGRQYVEAARPPSLRERFFDWLVETIGDLLRALSSGGGRGLIAWIIVLAFAGLIVFLISRLLRSYDAPIELDGDLDPDIEILRERSVDEWTKAALEHERAQRWRAALRCRHRALSRALIDADLVDARPGMTAAGLSRQATAHLGSSADALHRATDVFEEVWYGGAEADATTSARFETDAALVRAELSSIGVRSDGRGGVERAAMAPGGGA